MIVCSECAESLSGMYVPESVCRMVLLVSLLLKTETEYNSDGAAVLSMKGSMFNCSAIN